MRGQTCCKCQAGTRLYLTTQLRTDSQGDFVPGKPRWHYCIHPHNCAEHIPDTEVVVEGPEQALL